MNEKKSAAATRELEVLHWSEWFIHYTFFRTGISSVATICNARISPSPRVWVYSSAYFNEIINLAIYGAIIIIPSLHEQDFLFVAHFVCVLFCFWKSENDNCCHVFVSILKFISCEHWFTDPTRILENKIEHYFDEMSLHWPIGIWQGDRKKRKKK